MVGDRSRPWSRERNELPVDSLPCHRAAAYAVFFLSGAAALIYEVSWSRQVGAIVGHTSASAALVLAAYFTGLAIGQAVGAVMGRRKVAKHFTITITEHDLSFARDEAAIARAGKPARIIAKMNSLTDESVIRALYEASQAGVRIDLIVRGACSLRPGVKGLSESIRVRSIVGRFLEHTRIFYFRNNLKHDIYLSSADWMNRNLFRRVEVALPVRSPALKRRVLREGLHPYLNDNVNAWELGSDGHYRRKKTRNGQKAVSAQQDLMETLGAGAHANKENEHGPDPVAARRG